MGPFEFLGNLFTDSTDVISSTAHVISKTAVYCDQKISVELMNEINKDPDAIQQADELLKQIRQRRN